MFKTLIKAKIPQHFLLVHQIKPKLLIVVQKPLYVRSSLNFLLSSLSSRHTLFSSISISKLLLVLKSFWVFFLCQDFSSFHIECSLVLAFKSWLEGPSSMPLSLKEPVTPNSPVTFPCCPVLFLPHDSRLCTIFPPTLHASPAAQQ